MGWAARGECTIRGCGRPRYGANYCRNHLGQANNATLAEPTGRGRLKLPPKFCGIKDCDGRVIARGLCWRHYQMFRRAGGIEKRPDFRCEPIRRTRP